MRVIVRGVVKETMGVQACIKARVKERGMVLGVCAVLCGLDMKGHERGRVTGITRLCVKNDWVVLYIVLGSRLEHL